MGIVQLVVGRGINVSIHRLKSVALASAIALSAPAAAVAQQAAVPATAVPAAGLPVVSLPTAGSVAAIYDQYKIKPIWFRNGAPSVAATQLVQILRRSPLDGLGSGPQLADQIDAAVRATAGNPAAIPQAEQLMSSAWVLYVQTIKKPTQGMSLCPQCSGFHRSTGGSLRSSINFCRSEMLMPCNSMGGRFSGMAACCHCKPGEAMTGRERAQNSNRHGSRKTGRRRYRCGAGGGWLDSRRPCASRR